MVVLLFAFLSLSSALPSTDENKANLALESLRENSAPRRESIVQDSERELDDFEIFGEELGLQVAADYEAELLTSNTLPTHHALHLTEHVDDLPVEVSRLGTQSNKRKSSNPKKVMTNEFNHINKGVNDFVVTKIATKRRLPRRAHHSALKPDPMHSSNTLPVYPSREENIEGQIKSIAVVIYRWRFILSSGRFIDISVWVEARVSAENLQSFISSLVPLDFQN
jgi:hypothetical protein